MTLFFTDEEKKWIDIDLSKEYTLSCKDNAPDDIKDSIDKKIEAHKKWLKEMFGGVEKHEQER